MTRANAAAGVSASCPTKGTLNVSANVGVPLAEEAKKFFVAATVEPMQTTANYEELLAFPMTISRCSNSLHFRYQKITGGLFAGGKLFYNFRFRVQGFLNVTFPY